MTGIAAELGRCFAGHYKVLILDNEVTVDAFVTDPPFPWARLTAVGGVYRVGDGYPGFLTSITAGKEALNWDQVAETAIREALDKLGETVDLVVFGNNAGQGLPLAGALPVRLRAAHGIITYGTSLPEQSSYEALGYSRFIPRCDLAAHLSRAGDAGRRQAALGFINTIQHNQQNYHTPWHGRGN